MSNFYNQGQNSSSSGGGGSGFYNAGGGGYNNYSQPQFGQPQPQQQQQPGGYNASQWQQPQTNDNHAYQSSSSSSSQQQYNRQGGAGGRPQQQQQQQSPAFWTPDANAVSNTAANLVGGVMAKAATGGMTNEAILGAVFEGGREAWVSGGARMIPGLETGMQLLRTYFAVDNRYVKRKMQKVLFPFTSKQWRRSQVEGPNEINYALPYSDENAPDLYLPVMSLITYCLLCALLYGTAGQFNPEVIADVTTKCFITQILEVCIIRFGFYMMQAPVALLDLFSYTGYKYLGLTLNMLFGLAFGHLGYGTSGFYVTFLWTASAASFFMLKTMAHNIPTETASTGPKRELVVLGFAAMQAVTMWFVSQTKFL